MADIIYGATLALYVFAAFQSIIKSSQAFPPPSKLLQLYHWGAGSQVFDQVTAQLLL